ncbi:MAG: NAD(P)-dependent oxidoreductase [Actinomycetia bacterium]|nr:NAD(P)-dependent oxidoreductase [Actinomycetes bacterium]
MTPRVLVTGAAGTVGRCAVAQLIDAGWDVHATCRAEPPDLGPVTWHHGDLLVPGAAAQVVQAAQPSHVLHLAWHMAVGSWQTAGADENLAWVGASAELARTLNELGGERFVAAGSCTEYDWNNERFDEDSPRRPASFYGRCKAITHDLLTAYGTEADLSVAWGRIFFLHGPHENPRRLVPAVITALLKSEEAQTSDGLQARDYLHADDVASAYLCLLDRPEAVGAFNIASGHATTLRHMIEHIGATIGRSDLLDIGAIQRASTDTDRVVGDHERLAELGWAPGHTLESGLDATIDWWRDNLDPQEPRS